MQSIDRKEFDFLPLIKDLVRMIQADPDSVDNINKKLLELRDRFARCYQVLDQLEGGDLTEEQQKQLYNEQQLKLKHLSALLEKCRNLPILSSDLENDLNMNVNRSSNNSHTTATEQQQQQQQIADTTMTDE